MSEKIQKVLAQAGVASRRESERWIAAGRVTVNGRVATIGQRVEPKDKLSVDGRPLSAQKVKARPRVLIYHKPVGEICTRQDPEGRRTVFASLPPLRHGRWVAIGRLDINTSGLLLFTNHGELAHRMMHPSRQIDREYLIRVHGAVDEAMLKRLQQGILLDDGVARFKKISVGAATGSHCWFTCVLSEGRNREVRRLWESQGVEVSRLKRIRFGKVELPSYVRRGDWLDLDPRAISAVFDSVGIREQVPALTPQQKQQHLRQLNKLKARGRAGR